MSYDRLAEAVRLCEACPLGAVGRGVPGTWAGEPLSASQGEVVMVLGEAPGGVEMARGKPFVGQSGELLHSLLTEVGLTAYFVSNIAKHQPPKVKGKQQAPDAVAVEACAPFLRAEFELVKPTKLILLGKTAAKLVCEGNFSMSGVVNQTYRMPLPPTNDMRLPIDVLVLYHPSYFLRSRTAPWIQKQVREWKMAVKLFLGDKAPTYRIERVRCEAHA